MERGLAGRSVDGVSEGFELLPTKAIEPPNSFSASSGVKNTKERIPGGLFLISLAIGFKLLLERLYLNYRSGSACSGFLLWLPKR